MNYGGGLNISKIVSSNLWMLFFSFFLRFLVLSYYNLCICHVLSLGWYLRLAEVLVGKTGVPGVKTTVKDVKGFVPLRSGGVPLTVTLTVLVYDTWTTFNHSQIPKVFGIRAPAVFYFGSWIVKMHCQVVKRSNRQSKNSKPFSNPFQAIESTWKSVRNPADNNLDQNSFGRGSTSLTPQARSLWRLHVSFYLFNTGLEADFSKVSTKLTPL